ncbi:restriction endonuclease subunit R [Halorubrum persicum]|uniref:Restriction endonuclease subunit R n=1 Tax=Halorubrum persicum TaxID=1383844 RepID=A0A2G1WEM8_9EURY|nr:type I restriction enzyme HsdR N-terminal domain-containing protein [Halorubrum persicum]PHQ37448.1 restriction endonuclease subunit R [Halorubrum persicum]
MDEEMVSGYVERSQSLVESSPQMDEQNTRARLIDPFIKDVLGWDFYSTSIEMEYSVQMGSTKKKVDYALFTDGSPAVFVEAKGCDTTITESHADQLRSYMRQEWVDWGLLTNGKSFHVYRLKKDGDKPDVELLRRIALSDLTANDWLLAALSEESIQSGASTEIYQRVERRRQAIETLTDQKAAVSEALRETVVDRVGEVVSQPAESLSKTFVDDLIAELESDQNDSHNAARNSSQTKTESDHNKQTEAGDLSDAYVVEIADQTESTSFSDDSQANLMGTVVDHLIRDHDLIDAYAPLPYVPGKKIAILNDEPTHPSGEEMRLYRAVGGDYYVYTSLNKGDKKRHLTDFADAADVEITFDGDW